MLLTTAAVSSVLVTVATHVIRSLGYAGIGLLIAISAVIAVPGTELPMLFGGFNVYDHHLTLFGIIAAGLLGDILGASVAYAIGRYGGRELVERHGAKIHAKPDDLDRAHGWFERYGSGTMVVSRCLPVIRCAFPYAAGVSRMAYPRFLAMTSLGSLAWIAGLGVLGDAVGKQWQTWKHHLDYVDYAGVAIILLALAWGVSRWIRRARAERDAAAIASASGGSGGSASGMSGAPGVRSESRAVDVARD